MRRVSVKRKTEVALALARQEEKGTTTRLSSTVIDGIGRPGIFEPDVGVVDVTPFLDGVVRAHPQEV